MEALHIESCQAHMTTTMTLILLHVQSGKESSTFLQFTFSSFFYFLASAYIWLWKEIPAVLRLSTHDGFRQL
jgi:hypothetical protein